MLDKIIRFFTTLIAMISVLFANVQYGEWGEQTETVPPEIAVINDIDGDSSLSNSIKYADSIKNTVKCAYTSPKRAAYKMENTTVVFQHNIGKKEGAFAAVYSPNGHGFLQGEKEAFDAFYTDVDGNTYRISDSKDSGRINTIRLGEYYYECHVRDYGFTSGEFKLDKGYHVFGDRLYQELSVMSQEATTKLAAFGSEIRIPSGTVGSLTISDKNGTHSSIDGIDSATVEFAAFDISDAGVLGFIIPSDGSTAKTTVTLENGCYVLRQYSSFVSGTGINKYDETGGYELNKVSIGCRIWTEEAHDFDGIIKAAELERNPLSGITVTAGNAGGRFIGYNALRGTYDIAVNGTDFNYAYNNPDLQFRIPVTVACDNNDRDIIIRSIANSGSLESAGILDDTNTLVPIDVEVCKNFQGDVAESFYSVVDHAYGDSFFPVSLKSNEAISFTLLNLYQNWGKFPLKQLSSIEFHTSYYHLSTGTTESNCIAPYFVGDKDGWLLPDFRGRSGDMWSSQPQFNSVGVLKFVEYKNTASSVINDYTRSEYVSGRIDSVGQTYADITGYYISDCGSYTYSLRHVELPQTDENRTYYTVDIKFNREMSFNNFKRDFSLFSFDGRFVDYNKLSYVDSEGQNTVADVSKPAICPEYYPLGNDCPYYSLFDVKEKYRSQLENSFGSSFALIVRNSDITVGAEDSDIGFAVRRTVNKEKRSVCALTLNAERITFYPGDSITLNIVLVPWGTGKETTDDNARTVREDSALKPLRVQSVAVGKTIPDEFIPRVYCESNKAVFTVSGGRNNNIIRVDGFTCLNCPQITVESNGNSRQLELASSNGYDGYTVFYNPDGTYGFSFVYEADSPDTEYTFTVEQ